jgi:hypothetical protein
VGENPDNLGVKENVVRQRITWGEGIVVGANWSRRLACSVEKFTLTLPYNIQYYFSNQECQVDIPIRDMINNFSPP